MTLPVYPNQISFSNISSEFTFEGPIFQISLATFYSGGARVPTGTVGYPNGIETSVPVLGTISFSNFHGSAKIISSGDWSVNQLQDYGTASDIVLDDLHGSAVALNHSGNIAAVASGRASVGGAGAAGALYVFTRSGTTWTQQQKLSASNAQTSDNLGRFGPLALSNDGRYIIVGSAFEDPYGAAQGGSAYIFYRSDTGSWAQQANIVAASIYTYSNGEFGYSVDISDDGSRAVVGAPAWNASAGVNQGQVFIFRRSGTSWVEEARLTASDAANGDAFGSGVAIDSLGTKVVIGASREDPDSLANAGSAYVFTRSGTTWTQQQKLTAANRVAGKEFGRSVDISGDGNRLVVVARGNAGFVQGSVHIFNLSGATWAEDAVLDLGGYLERVSLSDDGTQLVVSHPTYGGAGVTNGGRVTIYSLVSGVWTLKTHLLPQYNLAETDIFPGIQYGSAVAISGNDSTILVGAQGDLSQGSFYIYSW